MFRCSGGQPDEKRTSPLRSSLPAQRAETPRLAPREAVGAPKSEPWLAARESGSDPLTTRPRSQREKASALARRDSGFKSRRGLHTLILTAVAEGRQVFSPCLALHTVAVHHLSRTIRIRHRRRSAASIRGGRDIAGARPVDPSRSRRRGRSPRRSEWVETSRTSASRRLGVA